MFEILLLILAILAGIHIWRLKSRTTERAGEIVLVYILAGYCGFAMLIVGTFVVVNPALAARMLGFSPGGSFEDFVGVCLIAMSLISVLVLRYRGNFLIAPAVCWTAYFVGATAIHIRNFRASGTQSHGGLLEIFATHGLIAVILAGALLASGLLRNPARVQA